MERRGAAEFGQAWRPPVAGIREAFHARFREHAYPPHVHDTWTLFVVDRGGVRYDLDRRPRAAEPTMVSILPPHVVHDGRAATDAGFEMRCLYLESDVLGEAAIGRAVDRPSLDAAGLRAAVSALHAALRSPDDVLEAETRLAFVVERLRATLGAADARTPVRVGATEADALRAVLDRHLTEPITLAAAAATVGGSPTGLARAFATTFGVAPHGYVLGRRLDAARERILGGSAIADVAAELGFADQAHLTRRFRQWFGTTPAAIRGGSGRSATDRSARRI